MEFTNQEPIYLQIAELICDKIMLKVLKEDSRIPSVREMAVQLEVNPNTVMRTYEYLQGKDIITNKRGIGYFVSTDGIEKAINLRKTAFLEVALPSIFKTAQLLGISVEELQNRYNAFIKNPSDLQK